jgi:hypothetical protein
MVLTGALVIGVEAVQRPTADAFRVLLGTSASEKCAAKPKWYVSQ